MSSPNNNGGFMHPQKQEERDFFPQSEHQLAYQASMMDRDPGDAEKIATLVKAGRFVVVGWHVHFCPHTDATLGKRVVYVADYLTRAEANKRMAEEWEKAGDCDGETGIYVSPPEPPLPFEEVATIHNPQDLPF